MIDECYRRALSGSTQKKGTVVSFYYRSEAIARRFGCAAPEKRALVYLPHSYSKAPSAPYPLLVLLHGIAGLESEWLSPEYAGPGFAKNILDVLIAEGEMPPAIVVFPNGRCCPSFSDVSAGRVDSTTIEPKENVRGFYYFDEELTGDLLPALERTYPVRRDRGGRALAGLSMGGMQTIDLGIGRCLFAFSRFGAFSCAPTTQCGVLTGRTIAEAGLPVWLHMTCGDADPVSYAVHRMAYMGLSEAAGAPLRALVCTDVAGGVHDFRVWNYALYAFARRAFGGEDGVYENVVADLSESK